MNYTLSRVYDGSIPLPEAARQKQQPSNNVGFHFGYGIGKHLLQTWPMES